MNEEFYCCNTMNIKSEKTLSPSSPPPPPPQKSTLRQALPQVLAVCVKNVLLLGFGMTLGFPTILIPSLSGNDPNETISLGQEGISWIGSLNLICVPIGCLLSGSVTQPIGRRRAMQIVNIPFLTAWLLFHFATDVWHIFLALCITGLTGGILEAPTLTYVAEITTPNLRGILCSTSTVAIISGILTQFLLGKFFSFRTVALVSCIVPLISFISLFFVPESPYWLVSMNRLSDAKKSIAWLRGWVEENEIEDEYNTLYEQFNKSNNNTEQRSKRTITENAKLYCEKRFLWPFSIVCIAFFFGHFSGMTTLQTYAVKIFGSLQAPIDKYFATIFLGVAEVCGCILSACLVHFVGKRKMNFFSLIGCGMSFLIVATYAFLINVRYFDNEISDEDYHENWIPMTFLIAAAFFTHTGIRILPWMLVGEVYYSDIRSTASGFSGAVSYIFGFLSNKIFFYMVNLFTLPGTLWFYSGMSFLGMIVLYFILPETEGKTLYEITEHFAGNCQMDNKVHRGNTTIGCNGMVNPAFADDKINHVSEESQL